MPRVQYRSRSLRRVTRKTPGGKTVTHFKTRKPKLGVCSVTGEKLKGVPRKRPHKMRTLPKSSKRPSRPFGGVLSSRAMRSTLKSRARTL